jgi:hypothetical protein
MLVNFSQLMNARWLRRLSDLSQRHRTSSEEEVVKLTGKKPVKTGQPRWGRVTLQS